MTTCLPQLVRGNRNAYVNAGAEFHTFGFQLLHPAIQHPLLHLEFWNPVAQQPADAVGLLEEGHQMPGARQLDRAGVDGAVRRITTVYDSQGRPAASINGLAIRTSFAYDGNSQCQRVQDGLGNITTMLHDSLTAFVNHDMDAARAVCMRDDEVDALYDTVYAVTINKMILEPAAITPLTYHLWTAHNLERIADRATNIAERVVFLVTGRMDELNVSRY